jgi:dihydropyrimidinase
MVHAESGEAIDYLEQVAQREGHTRPVDYPATRPAYAEAEAVSRAVTFGTAAGCPVYVVHLTSQAALEQLLLAQAAGRDVQAETCPQYLVLTAAEMERQGPLAKIAPPLRSTEDQAALWHALADGQLSVIASDHAPYPSQQKRLGTDDIFASPFGAPTVETLLPVAYSEGVHRRRLPLEWLSWVTSEGPARVTGLYPRKGVLQLGSDADLVLVDPSRRVTVDAQQLHSAADYSPFAGLELQGWPVATVVGGKLLVQDGQLVRDASNARFLVRGRLDGRLSDRLAVHHGARATPSKGFA